MLQYKIRLSSSRPTMMKPNSYGNENQAVTGNLKSRLLIIGTNSPSTRNYLVGLNLTF